MHSCWVLRISWAKAGLLISETASKIRRCLGFPTVSGVMVPERYPSRFAVSKICCAVASLTWPGRENALETVEGDTPAARATSTIPGYVLCLDISCATGVWEFSLQYMLYVPLVTDCNIYGMCMSVGSLGILRTTDAEGRVAVGGLGTAQSTDGEKYVSVGRLSSGLGNPLETES